MRVTTGTISDIARAGYNSGEGGLSIELITDGARDQREWDARLRLARTIFNTYGFGSLGGSLAEPLLRGATFTGWHMVGVIVGIAAHGIALYLAPKGGADATVR